MHPRTQTTNRVRLALLAAIVAGIAANASAQTSAATTAPGLKDLFEAAWARQPEAQALQARRDAAQAQRRAAQSWTPDPPAFEASHKTDRLTRNDGARELEVGIAVPLWLPSERRSTGALADAELAATESRASAARLRLAASVRDAWWHWQRAGIELEIARGQLDSACRLASDVSRHAKAGELARADQHQADGAVAAAEAGLAAGEAALKPMNGGDVVEVKDMDYELVAKPTAIQVYLRDHGKKVDVTKVTAMLTLLTGAEKQEVDLKPAGDKLEAMGTFKAGPGTKAVAVLTVTSKPATARFALK